MARSIRHGAFVVAACVWASSGLAQESAVAKNPLQINPPGAYEGVKPGGNQPPPVAATPNTTPTQITWPGFQMRPDGGSRVFIQSTSALSTSVSQKGNLMLIDLGPAKVSGETNQFALYTRFFNTPVVRAQLKNGSRAVLEIELRAAVQPNISTEQAASGFHFLYIDFPPGNYLAKGAGPAPAPSPTNDMPARVAAPAPAAPAHLDDAPPAPPEPGKSSVKADVSMDNELPPGQVKTKGKAGFKL